MAVNKTRRTLTGMAIVLSMGLLLSLPPGVHLKICFGFDGHVDATPDSCMADLEETIGHHVEGVLNHHHHESCLDLVIGCASLDAILRNADKSELFGTDAIRGDLFITAKNASNEARPGHYGYAGTALYPGDMPSPSLFSHQTVVLLI